MVRINDNRYGEFTPLLDKAMQAYTDGLGAGAVVYLRKIFEKITVKAAKAVDIEYAQYDGGNPKNFSDLLKKVDEKCSIIPKEFSANGYKLFRELSGVVHGEYDEEAGLKNFEALHRLVIGILEKQFYEEAYRFGCEIYGEDNIVSAVMHADEINKAVSEELGKPVYHYHLHIVAIPTVRKEILWSKRCKDEALRGTVKEVINQVSHSKKWKNTVPLLDENGQQVISKYGKPMFRKSYSVLQDKLFEHMTEAGFTGFERGVLGSTAENLSSLDYQIQKDKERLAHIQERIEAEQVRYEPVHEVRKTMAEIEGMGQKTITGKIAVSKDDYQQLTALAKEGITSRSEIQDLKSSVSYYQRQYFNASSAVERLQERYDRLKEKCQPFLQALEHFPKLVEVFVEKVKELFSIKEAQERKEREDRAAARKEQSKHRRDRNDWER